MEKRKKGNISRAMDEVVEFITDSLGAEIPMTALPDPNVLNYYIFLQERKFFLYDNVENNCDLLVDLILKANLEDRKEAVEDRTPITVYIMSPGGELDYMWSLVDLIQASKTPIFTVNIGIAESAAALVFLAGHRRFMLPNAKVMFHQGSAVMAGDANKVIDFTENYTREISQMNNLVLEQTKIPQDLMAAHRKDDWYLNAKECLKYGICHEIVTNIDAII